MPASPMNNHCAGVGIGQPASAVNAAQTIVVSEK